MSNTAKKKVQAKTKTAVNSKAKTTKKTTTSVKKKATAAKKKTATVKKKTGSVSKATTKAKRKKRNVNLSRLHTEMNKMVNDAVDREIVKRFKTIIDTSDEDITKVNVSLLINDPKSIDIGIFDESLQAYIKHYLFMRKRTKK